DTSHHPFCGGIPEDVRITTRWNEDDFLRGLLTVVHETGHALYERGLPAAWRRHPVGRARGMSFHEGQSLLVEMQVCRSGAFLSWLAPIAREAFAARLPRKSGGVVGHANSAGDGAWSAAALRRRATRVARTLIRVDADEVTYPAHVVLRYRLERAMIDGRLDPADLPGAWREGLREVLGVEPPDDRTGCLQDIHWYAGAFGYFPTYTMGAMTAAQLFDAARRASPGIEADIAQGHVDGLLAWLRENVHSLGSLLPTRDLLVRATGRPLDAAIFRRHLERRYLRDEAD
ncbi:MAG: carboxypeptidase M32, partial [Alphaproteobacteria bacterium]